MKHYIDIENLKESDIEITERLIRQSNDKAFVPGDTICISEKIDGSNASFRYDKDTDSFLAFSRKQELTFNNTLNGFYNFVKDIEEKYKAELNNPNFIYFGEWTGARNKLVYSDESKKKWYLFDIYCTATNTYMPQSFVIKIADRFNFDYANLLYEGPFINWEHCRSFMNSPSYGKEQEGIVVKNQSKLASTDNRNPAYLKLVNSSFLESKPHVLKQADPEKEAARINAILLAQIIVTENRVFKMLTKLRDEGVLKPELSAADMSTVAKILPKLIYEDCLKEEPEIVKALGEFAGKVISSETMKIARKLICG